MAAGSRTCSPRRSSREGASAPAEKLLRLRSVRLRIRALVAIVAVVLTATLCAAALATVGGDGGGVLPGAEAAAALHAAAPGGDRARHAALTGRLKLIPTDRLSWPVHGAITGAFGEARSGHMHEGIDVPEPPGTPIRAAAPGKVVMREVQDGYGNYTCIAHRTVTTCYGHQSRFGVHLGERVRRGQVIGYVGNTGDSPAFHLHFEVRRGTKPWGKAVNPVKRLPH
jgi:murein DD-endopeptidase MepM/ murein hydrolase activator NlpD